MFNQNRNIKVGRDININLKKNNLEHLNREGLLEKKKSSNLILKKETYLKLRKTLNYIVFSIIIFLIIYFVIPIILVKYTDENNKILTFLIKISQDKKAALILSTLAAIATIITPLSNLWKSNHIEIKQYEILKSINTILKEREYLK